MRKIKKNREIWFEKIVFIFYKPVHWKGIFLIIFLSCAIPGIITLRMWCELHKLNKLILNICDLTVLAIIAYSVLLIFRHSGTIKNLPEDWFYGGDEPSDRF